MISKRMTPLGSRSTFELILDVNRAPKGGKSHDRLWDQPKRHVMAVRGGSGV